MRLPTNFVSIFAAVLIACAGYIFFGFRYGAPIREVNEVVTRVEGVERRIHDLGQRVNKIAGDTQPRGVTPSISQQDAEETDPSPADEQAPDKTSTAPSSEPGVSLEEVEDRISTLRAEQTLTQAALAERVETLEGEIQYLQGMIRNMEADALVQQQGSPATVPATPTSAGTGSQAPPSDPEGAQPPTTHVHIKDGLRIEILSARVNDDYVYVEITVTKVTPGDGYAEIHGDDRARIVTATGVQLAFSNAKRPGANWAYRTGLEAISGTPMKFTISYKGAIPKAPFVARRVVIKAYASEDRDRPLFFEFENVLVAE